MLPLIAEKLNLEYTNKEGWISGLADVVLENRPENNIDLAVAFPAPEKICSGENGICVNTVSVKNSEIVCYGFREDTTRPDLYDAGLESRLGKIINAFQPDIVHCFGMEYPHTLAMCRVFPRKDRLLLGIQGLCSACACAYFADMP